MLIRAESNVKTYCRLLPTEQLEKRRLPGQTLVVIFGVGIRYGLAVKFALPVGIRWPEMVLLAPNLPGTQDRDKESASIVHRLGVKPSAAHYYA